MICLMGLSSDIPLADLTTLASFSNCVRASNDSISRIRKNLVTAMSVVFCFVNLLIRSLLNTAQLSSLFSFIKPTPQVMASPLSQWIAILSILLSDSPSTFPSVSIKSVQLKTLFLPSPENSPIVFAADAMLRS